MSKWSSTNLQAFSFEPRLKILKIALQSVQITVLLGVLLRALDRGCGGGVVVRLAQLEFGGTANDLAVGIKAQGTQHFGGIDGWWAL